MRWVEELYMHLENIGWLGVTALLKRFRTEEISVTDIPDTLIEGAYTSTGGTSNKSEAEIQ